ncbi:MAG: adenosine deaminase family protein [Deltaproteobacteria bacterium]|nr:MAG: adenosine deaminase family protein [Deltaproteobacteria bacterium]
MPREFIRAIPKTDLHVHLDGSIRIPTLIELAKENSVPLPSYTEEGLKETVFKERYNNLGEYLSGFQYTVAAMQNDEALERTAYELACDNFAEGVRYLEVRFAPQLHCRPGFEIVDVLRAVNRGMLRAQNEFARFPAIANGEEPPFRYGIIVCAMRMFTKGFSEYYRRFAGMFSNTSKNRLYGLASMVLAEAIVGIMRSDEELPIVAFDLAGQEDGYPAEDHMEAFQFVHKNFLKKTVHAGEAYGPESIFQALTDLHADRIGHCYHLFSPDRIQDPRIKDPERYVRELAQYIADRRITLEVCLTSNLQTMPELNSLSEHNFKMMLDAKLSACLCTDNRTVSSTTVSREIELAVEHFNLSPRQLRHIVIYGFKRSFFPEGYMLKRQYVRQIIDYYEKIEEQYGISSEHQDNPATLELEK